jgi:NAD(P)-dependent dehydrogenase (short-subunit alcohol dehydrogenase family)
MRAFVTGGAGFIGRHLLPLLLARGDEVTVLVLAGEAERFEALRRRLDPGDRLRTVVGDITVAGLGLGPEDRAALAGADVFHLAAVYDLLADAEITRRVNVAGTRNVLRLAAEAGAARVHHVSSIAVAGRYRGRFTEEMFDEGQELDHPYFRTKFEAEAAVREEARIPWRIYRPAVVVGSSETGEADRVDGHYYAFKLIQRLRDALPSWVPLMAPEGGPFNLVPVDYVVRALDHIAHLEGMDGRVFHLVDPEPLSLGDTLNTFCRAAHAPEFAMRVDRAITSRLPRRALAAVGQLPAPARVQHQVLDALGIPEAALGYMDYPCTFDAAGAREALRDSGITCPPLATYAWRVWDHWERHLDPELLTERNLRRRLAGRVVVVTGAAAGIGRAVCLRIAPTGALIVAVDRDATALHSLETEIRDAGGAVSVHTADLRDLDVCNSVAELILAEHGRVDVLVNNAGRSIRRSVMQSVDRLHDFQRTMQLNYFAPVALVLALLPSMRERGSGQIVNVSSIATQAHPPRFAAYAASKSALDSFSRCLDAEVRADGVAVTTIHMPLVRTAMTAPTSVYRTLPMMGADDAAELVLRGLLTRAHEVSTRLGKLGEVLTSVTPALASLIMSAAYAILPDTGEVAGNGDAAARARFGAEALALGQVMRGVHL